MARGLTGQPPAGNMRQLQWDQELARSVNVILILMVELVTVGASTLADQKTFNSLTNYPDLPSKHLLPESSVDPQAIIAP